MMRLVLAFAAALAVGVLGALILGEYPFRGAVVLVSGVVLGLFIAEAALTVNGSQRSVALGIGCAVIGLAAMTWAAWIAEGRDLSYVGPAGWTAVALTGLAAGIRTGFRRGGDSPAPAPAPATSPEDRSP